MKKSIENAFNYTRDYMNENIKFEEYISVLKSVYNEVGNEISGSDKALSYLESAKLGIVFLSKLKDSNHTIRKKALVCDIYNNLAHSLGSIQNTRYEGENTYRNKNLLFGVKVYSIDNIVKDLSKNKENSKTYGFVSNGESNLQFVADIPLVGQVAWHLNANRSNNKCNKYPYNVIRKKSDITNIAFLTSRVSEKEMMNFPEHMKIVKDAKSYKKMNSDLDNLYKKETDIKTQIKEVIGDSSITIEDSKVIKKVIDSVVPVKEVGSVL